MQVNEAVEKAKQALKEVFAEENPSMIRLEEVVLSSSQSWLITLSYFRSLTDASAESSGLTAFVAAVNQAKRVYKIIEVKKSTGEVISIKMRVNE